MERLLHEISFVPAGQFTRYGEVVVCGSIILFLFFKTLLPIGMPSGGHRIVPTLLYVEDSPEDRLFMRALVERDRAEFRLVTVASYPEAIDYILGQGHFADRRHNPEANLVLADFLLAKGTAIDLLRWLRQRPVYRSLPVVIFSSTHDPLALQRCLEAGADVCVVKPASYSNWGKIVTALREWLASGRANMEALYAVTSPVLTQRRLRGELQTNLQERRRLVEERHAIARYLDGLAASQKENKKQFPFPGKRRDSGTSSQ